MVKAALVQLHLSNDKQENVGKASEFVRRAAGQGAKVICLPELFNTIYFCFAEDPKFYELAEPIPGPTIDAMAKVAQEEKIVLVAPIYEKVMKGVMHNTAAVLGPDGELIGRYRKNNIPLVRTPETSGDEKYYFKPGDLGFPVFPTPFGVTIGIVICYDRHFPEGPRILALKGADLLLVPIATLGISQPIFELELRAHAVANGFFVGGVNRVGADEGGFPGRFFGSSIFVNPKGEITAQASDKEDDIIYADIDLEMIEYFRDAWCFFRDRRPDIYGPIASL